MPSPTPGVVVLTEARNGARSVLVRMPLPLLDRLKRRTEGGYTVAIAALVDWALDRLQAEGQTLTFLPTRNQDLPRHGVFVRLPWPVVGRLKSQTEGGYTVAISALVDWALDRLQAEGQTLTVRPRT